jgi:DNA-binding protein H-NS
MAYKVDDCSIDAILSSENLTVDVARTIVLGQQKQIVSQQKQIATQQEQIVELQETIEQLVKANDKSPTDRLDESYSLSAEENASNGSKRKPARKRRKPNGKTNVMLA